MVQKAVDFEVSVCAAVINIPDNRYCCVLPLPGICPIYTWRKAVGCGPWLLKSAAEAVRRNCTVESAGVFGWLLLAVKAEAGVSGVCLAAGFWHATRPLSKRKIKILRKVCCYRGISRLIKI